MNKGVVAVRFRKNKSNFLYLCPTLFSSTWTIVQIWEEEQNSEAECIHTASGITSEVWGEQPLSRMNIMSVPVLPIDWVQLELAEGLPTPWIWSPPSQLVWISSSLDMSWLWNILHMATARWSSHPLLLPWGFFSHNNFRLALTKTQLDGNIC